MPGLPGQDRNHHRGQTQGHADVEAVGEMAPSGREEELLRMAGVRAMSEHPLGQTVNEFAREKQMELPMPTLALRETITGAGDLHPMGRTGAWR